MSSFDLVEAWDGARSRGAARRMADVIPTDARETADKAFSRSPRARMMRAESERSGMAYGAVASLEREADAWLAAADSARGGAAAARWAQDVAGPLAALWERVTTRSGPRYYGTDAAASWAVLCPVDYGQADTVTEAYASLAAVSEAGDSAAAGIRVIDPAHAYRRTRWTRERQRPGYPWPTRWDAEGRLVADTLPLLYVNGRPVAQTRRDLTGRRNARRIGDGIGGRKATHKDHAARQAAYRERQRAAREAAARRPAGEAPADYRDA
jgi:hypothetical protein